MSTKKNLVIIKLENQKLAIVPQTFVAILWKFSKKRKSWSSSFHEILASNEHRQQSKMVLVVFESTMNLLYWNGSQIAVNFYILCLSPLLYCSQKATSNLILQTIIYFPMLYNLNLLLAIAKSFWRIVLEILHDHNNIKHFDILQKRSNHYWIQKHQFHILIVVKLITNLVIETCMWILNCNRWWFLNNFLPRYGLFILLNKITNGFQTNRTNFLEFCVKH